tara:strand:+ start:1279 stop:1431 length:153 start_codon:yes stop_codon:yes gene_type:complete
MIKDITKDISESLTFLLKEYKRLKKKKEMNKISNSENETLKKLSSFLGKK